MIIIIKNPIAVFITSYFLIASNLASGQSVEIIRKSEFNPPTREKDFAFIDPASDTSTFTFIATLKASATGKQSGIDYLYYKLRDKAQEFGSNSFKLVSFEKIDSTQTASLTLDVYFAPYTALSANFQHHEKNVVYIFGNAGGSDKSSSFKIDNAKKELKGGTYFKQALTEGKEVKINKGGFTGATYWVNWKENRPAIFLTLTGFGLGGAPPVPGVVGLSFNTGRINYMDDNLGHLLTLLLTPGN